MRAFVAVLLLGFSLFPGMALAKKKPPQIIPALANAKVIGVRCDSGQSPISPQACQQVIASLRSLLGDAFNIFRPDVISHPLGFSAQADESQPDLYIEVWNG
ncbi:MAG: hypothetical protein ACRD2O_09685 [Terriglobia bacterium]